MIKARPIALAAALSGGLAIASFSLAQQQSGQGAAQQSGQSGQSSQSGQRDTGGASRSQGQTGQSGQSGQAGQQGQQQQASDWDKEFVKHCHSNNQFEIQLAQFIQQQQDLDPQTKELAQRLIQDHQRADQQLQQVAQQIGVEWKNDLMPVHKAKLEAFKQKKGDMLEKSYAFDQAGNHYKGVLEAQFMAQNSQSQPVKQYAQQTSSSLQQHLQMATRAAGGDMARLVSGEAGGQHSQQGQQGQQGSQIRSGQQQGQQGQQPGQSGTSGSSGTSGGRTGGQTSGGTSGSGTSGSGTSGSGSGTSGSGSGTSGSGTSGSGTSGGTTTPR